jgi:hypothetical protein
MGFFTPRERASLGKSADMREQDKVRELVRHDFAPRPRPANHERPTNYERPANYDRPSHSRPNHDWPNQERPAQERPTQERPTQERLAPERPAPDRPRQDLAGHVGTLMQRVSDTSVREIDELIAVLQQRREALLSESARMQREIVEYAKLNQVTLHSTRIITESLAAFRRVPDAPSISEPLVEPMPEMAEPEVTEPEMAEPTSAAEAMAAVDLAAENLANAVASAAEEAVALSDASEAPAEESHEPAEAQVRTTELHESTETEPR